MLDLGCATGTTGAALKQRQRVEVVGIELEPTYAQEARTHLDRAIRTLITFQHVIASHRGLPPPGPPANSD